MSRPVYVYVIAHQREGCISEPVKVGIAKNPIKRVETLQSGNPNKLVVAAAFFTPSRDVAFELEAAFHETMAGCRMTGEWFSASPRDAVLMLGAIIVGTFVDCEGISVPQAQRLMIRSLTFPKQHSRMTRH